MDTDTFHYAAGETQKEIIRKQFKPRRVLFNVVKDDGLGTCAFIDPGAVKSPEKA